MTTNFCLVLISTKASAIFPYNPILHYAYISLLKENNSANNRLPLGLCALWFASARDVSLRLKHAKLINLPA